MFPVSSEGRMKQLVDYSLSGIVPTRGFCYEMWTLTVCLLISQLFPIGTSILCYECNSATNSHCFDGADLIPELKRNCSELDRGVTHTMCRKIVQDVDHGINGQVPESRVIRTCGWDESKYKGKCYQRYGYGGRQEVCSCLTDFCNDSHRFTSAIYLVVIGVAASILTA